MQGHNYSNFARPQIQAMLLRGIAWAGKRSGRHVDDRTPRSAAAAAAARRPRPRRARRTIGTGLGGELGLGQLGTRGLADLRARDSGAGIPAELEPGDWQLVQLERSCQLKLSEADSEQCLTSRSESIDPARGSASPTRTASSTAAGSAAGCPKASSTAGPVIGICNTWSELTPCNAHFRELAEHVKRGVWEAGGLPLEFPVMSLGETSMRPTAMLFRNLVSMDVEESIRANPIDGVVLLCGCDKTTPGAGDGRGQLRPAGASSSRAGRC